MRYVQIFLVSFVLTLVFIVFLAGGRADYMERQRNRDKGFLNRCVANRDKIRPWKKKTKD